VPKTQRILPIPIDPRNRLSGQEISMKVQTILVPTDFSPDGRSALAKTKDFARASASNQVDAVVAATAKDGIQAEGLLIEDRPAPAIIDAAKRLPADLIVMGTRGLTGLAHVVLGSVADRVLREASCPVLTVKATD